MLIVHKMIVAAVAVATIPSIVVAQDYNRSDTTAQGRYDDRDRSDRDRNDARRDDRRDDRRNDNKRRYADQRGGRDDRNRSYEDCRDDKRNAGKQGTAIGAVGGGGGTAILGGGLGGSLLGAGAGAVAGNVIGRSTEKCGKYRR